jgi:wyosine [tRNA(Phe)-imidazoG37] synthetase (radical SAM superfamily)
VREACALADVVLPTLAACSETQFQQVHRPADGLTLARHVAGLEAFTREHATPMWLELFLIEGMNAGDADLPAFVELIERIGPARVQLNTAVRPTAEEDVIAVSPVKLAAWAAALGPTAEVIADFARAKGGEFAVEASSVLSMCQRRPCTLEDVASGLSLHPAEASKLLTDLLSAGRVRSKWRDKREYFVGA